MYQAIVFLPLIGSIIAGAIALWGAHQRHPGGEADAGAEDHASAYVDEHHAHGAPTGSSVIHGSHSEPEEHAPAALVTQGRGAWGLETACQNVPKLRNAQE